MKLKGLSQRLYNIFFHTHTVAGITISAALFVIFYAGAFSLFRAEIHQWENPASRGVVPIELQVSKSIAAVRAIEPNFDETKRITIRSGNEHTPQGHLFGARALTDSTSAFFSAIIETEGGYKAIPNEKDKTTIGDTLYKLHYFRQIPVIGVYLSGLVALFFLFATVTGVLIHWRNIVTKFYAFTTKPKWKQIWTNAHTVLGMIGLPLQIMYAITGAFYGILILLLIPSALILFGGDQAKIIAAVRPSEAFTVSDSAAIVDYSNIDALVLQAQNRYPGVSVSNIRFQNYGRADGLMTINFDDKRTIGGVGQIIYRAYTGEVLSEIVPGKAGYTDSVISVIGRLHFATYGGVGVKVVYFILALLTCFMILSGILLWQAARDKKSYTDKEKRFHHRVTKFNLAFCLSLFPAVAVIFLANKFIPMEIADRKSYVDSVFFSAWLVFMLAGLRWNEYRRLNRNYLLLGGVLGIMIPVANGIMTGDWLWSTLAHGWFYVAAVDMFWLFTGLTALLIYRISGQQQKIQDRLPAKQPIKRVATSAPLSV